jgi:hypothetical protein
MPVTIEPLTPKQLDNVIEKLTNPTTRQYRKFKTGHQAVYEEELEPPLMEFRYSVCGFDGKNKFHSYASILTRMDELGQPRNNWGFDDIVRSSIKPSYVKGEGKFQIDVSEFEYSSGQSTNRAGISLAHQENVPLTADNLSKMSNLAISTASTLMDMIYTVYTRKGTVRREHVDAMERPDTKKSPNITIKPLRWVGRK